MRKLALFDFDGTLTKKDTFLEFIKFYRGAHSFYLGFLVLSPLLVLYKLKVIPNWKAKEYVLRWFFEGESLEFFNKQGSAFAIDRIPGMLRSEAYQKFLWHKKNDHKVVVVTASAVNWVKPWAEREGAGVAGTELEVKNGKLTGRISGRNCYGSEKVNRVCQILAFEDYDEVYVYGDSRGDRELLQKATHPFYRRFDSPS